MLSAPPLHCVYLRPLRDSVCLLYKTFSLLLHISEEPFVILYFQRVGLLANRLYLYKKKGVEETIFSFTPFRFVEA